MVYSLSERKVEERVSEKLAERKIAVPRLT